MALLVRTVFFFTASPDTPLARRDLESHEPMPPEPAVLQISANADRYRYPPIAPGDLDEPLIEQTLLGTVLPVEMAEKLPTVRDELIAFDCEDGSISFRTEPVRDEFVVHRLETDEIRSTDRRLVPRERAEGLVAKLIAERGPGVVGKPPLATLKRWQGLDAMPFTISDDFKVDPLANSIIKERVTRVCMSSQMGATEALTMLMAMFPFERLLVFATNRHQIEDVIAELRSAGITATDRSDLDARVVVTRATDGFAKPVRVQHRRLVVVLNEANLTQPLAYELSQHADTSKLVVFSSINTLDTDDDKSRIETWYSNRQHLRYVAVAPPREIKGTFAVPKSPQRSASSKAQTAFAALRTHVTENQPFLQTLGRMLNQNVSKWTERLSRCDKAIVAGMASPVVVVCSTLRQGVNLLKHAKRAVLATSHAKIARQHAGAASNRVVSLRGDLRHADRIVLTLDDFARLKAVGSILRVDCSPGPVPITEKQHERWGVAGVNSPIHVIDLHRVDFDLGRAHAASRAACYAADRTPFAHAPKFDRLRMPPIRYTIGCGYGTRHVVYHRRPPAERRGR